MRSALLALLYASFLVTEIPYVRAQSVTSSTPGEFRYDVGAIANGVYTNDCFGLSIAIPPNWTVSKLLEKGSALHLRGGQLELLNLSKDMNGAKGTIATLSGDPSHDPLLSAEDVVNNSALTQVAADPSHRRIVRAAYAVSYGERTFYRTDFTKVSTTGETLYFAYLATLFRGHYITAWLMGEAPERLNEAADVLKTISFQSGAANPQCVVGPDESAGKAGLIGGLPKNGSVKFSPAQRVRVSSSVSQALLQTRVDPEYSDAARQAGVHGPVVLQAIVGPTGEVQETTVISGDPLLVPAAIAAVKKWKYQPYLLAGQPVTMDTAITVDFPQQR